ncbi:uncharacterized protein SPAPADRAFT_61629 [Spathaspora passalidarum NRRL Y-27907]|uniref:Uncharacterized protein n=1 Tax=Spathaspora passalidarum (strain NRRL Y-27907 / 11-Y1) TaxID=619300 RepID=G3ANN6_SPAPN|nr:uncharacterized protein SPAPADRAFT_61629 [Spathaspora passalidarum NRRL Y-27907]EGW32564.1 hypothetical protein SPAPADRAFT_61629 [Spathaspora passalidarum NRRL Y-27907]
MVQDKNSKINIGLELKFETKREKVLGYTRKSNNGKFWEFSPLAITLINSYKTKFPQLFAKLSALSSKDIPKVAEISSSEEIKEVRSWLKEAKADLIPVSLESESLTKFSFRAIEQYMETYILDQVPTVDRAIRGVPRDAILNASESYQLLGDQRFELGDRIVYVQDFGKVPIMSKGTVASILTVGSKTSLGVIFDHPLLGGSDMNGKLTSKRGLVIDSSLVLNLTNRQYVYHSRASKSRKPLTPEQQAARVKAVEHKKVEQDHKRVEQEQKRIEQDQKKSEQDKEKQNLIKQESQKQTHELLSLLKIKSDSKAAEHEQSSGDKDEQAVTNPNAIKHIYGQIYSSVMNQGAAPPQPMPLPPQPPVGMPIPIPRGNGMGMPYGYIPAVPGIPIPPQFLQQQQQQQQQPSQVVNPNGEDQQAINQQEKGESQEHRGSEGQRRGRGGHRVAHRGRGAHRGAVHSRGGHSRGRGGKGKPKSESDPEKN